jgi:hypothetical protein
MAIMLPTGSKYLSIDINGVRTTPNPSLIPPLDWIGQNEYIEGFDNWKRFRIKIHHLSSDLSLLHPKTQFVLAPSSAKLSPILTASTTRP